MRRRFQAGELARVDANLAQSENLDAQAALATARSERLQAEQVFHTLSGMAAPAALAPEPAPTVGVVPAAIHPQLAVDRAAVQLARPVGGGRRDTAGSARTGTAVANCASAVPAATRMRMRWASSSTLPFSLGPRARQEVRAARRTCTQAEAQVALQERKLAQETAKAHRERATTQQQLGMAAAPGAHGGQPGAGRKKAFTWANLISWPCCAPPRLAREAEASLQREEIAWPPRSPV
ncbi:MAG: hypothetical protein IPJ36_04765 [Simplicispira sp.]|nr:hypothetical protein [Simplicispira sp.]